MRLLYMSINFNSTINQNYIVSIMATQREILTKKLYKFLITKGDYTDIPYNILYKFLFTPSSNEYKKTIGILQDFVNISQKDDHDISHIYRIVATIPDGTIWYDSSKGEKNTWENFQSKTINENHNSRACIMEVLLNNNRSSFEMKYSSTTKTNEYRVSFRLGDNRYYPLGVLGYSFGGNILGI